jgi:hypothetical protein
MDLITILNSCHHHRGLVYHRARFTPGNKSSEKCSEALHILDRFHIVAKMNKARDEVRAGESRRMANGRRDARPEGVTLTAAQT